MTGAGRVEELGAEVSRLQGIIDNVILMASCHKQEARTQASTVHEIYQICTGATGEPGSWNGAEPVRKLKAENERLRGLLDDLCDHIHDFVPHQWQENLAPYFAWEKERKP